MNESLDIKEYLKQVVKDTEKIFHELISWSDTQKRQFSMLLEDLKKTGKNTKEVGDKLERIVEFIVKNSFFFEIFQNVRTQTNEIDEVIVISDSGRIALKQFDIPKDILQIKSDIFLGECKNYSSPVGVTHVGKFYSLMSSNNISFGIIFTVNGLTGNPKSYEDAYGLVKILRLIERYKDKKGENFYILVFSEQDYQKLLCGFSFIDLIKAKKLEIDLNANYEQFLRDNKHEAEEQIKDIIGNFTASLDSVKHS